jgi:hypothetical protein
VEHEKMKIFLCVHAQVRARERHHLWEFARPAGPGMCGRAGMTVGAANVRRCVVNEGVSVDAAPPATYTTGTTKSAAKGDAYPCVVLRAGGLGLETLSFGVPRLGGAHCVFDDWPTKPTWRAAANAPGGRCAVVRDSRRGAAKTRLELRPRS